jgi:hypothetical protein
MKTMSVPWFMYLQELQKMTEANLFLVHLVPFTVENAADY